MSSSGDLLWRRGRFWINRPLKNTRLLGHVGTPCCKVSPGPEGSERVPGIRRAMTAKQTSSTRIWMTGMTDKRKRQKTPRELAVGILDRIDQRGEYAEPLLDDALSGTDIANPLDRGLLTELVYGKLLPTTEQMPNRAPVDVRRYHSQAFLICRTIGTMPLMNGRLYETDRQ